MPERSAHHVLNGSRLAVGEFNFNLLTTRSGVRTWTRRFGRIWVSWLLRLFRLRLHRLPVPLRIAEVKMRLHEVVNREVVLSVIEPRAAPDDLLELDHRVDRPHQDDI